MSGSLTRRPRSPRVLMTADAVGGVWTYALDLAHGLAQHGVDTVLVTLGPSPADEQLARARSVPGLELVDTNLPLDWLARERAEVLEVGAALRGLARGMGVDIVHLNGPAYAALGGFPAPVVGVCHSCQATWWSAVKDGPMPADFRWRSQLLWQGMLACDLLVAPSMAFAEATARAYEAPRPFVVWNGRSPERAPAQPRGRFVFTSGRLWDEGKNVGVLDEVAARLDAPLHAAGPLQGLDGGTVVLRHAQAMGRLPASEVAGWLTRAPVYASSALYEPFGLGVLEAAQAGCALVLSDIPTFRELWDGAALFAAPDDAASFAARCQALLDAPEEAARLGREAQARAARYTVEAMAAGMLDIYRLRRPELFAQARAAAE